MRGSGGAAAALPGVCARAHIRRSGDRVFFIVPPLVHLPMNQSRSGKVLMKLWFC